MKSRFLLIFIFIFSTPLFCTNIILWHSFEGFVKQKFEEIISDYNSSQSANKVNSSYQGNYYQVINNALQQQSLGTHPHLFIGYEVGTQTLLQKNKNFIPVEDLLNEYYPGFLNTNDYIDVIGGFYSLNGKMIALPWNASTGILFYNKEAFLKAGIDPNMPPQTWEEFEVYSEKLVKAGYSGFTTAWPCAYHLEHVCTLHDVPFATFNNGFESSSARLIFNSSFPIFHLTKLVEWQSKNFFLYGTIDNDYAEKLFTEGKCAILLQGANRLPLLKGRVKFEIGFGMLPYWKGWVEKPGNLNIGGGAIWAMSGFSKDENQAVADFVHYLATPKVQARWHEAIGYLPVTYSAMNISLANGTYERNPSAKIALDSVIRGNPSAVSKGIRLGNYIEIRDLITKMLEKAFNGELTPKEALDQAVEQGNLLLEQFQLDSEKFR